MITEDQVIEALQGVTDPEIPVISVIDLGIIDGIRILPGNIVEVDMTPTFAGCPALDYMSANIRDAVSQRGAAEVRVKILYNNTWSSNKITPKGKKLLQDFGLSPPPAFEGILTLEVLEGAICPVCKSNNTFLMNPFGPTACRAVHHCNNCHETFQQFKPL